MARVFTDGAEFGDTLFWSIQTGISAATDRVRSGTYSYKRSTNGSMQKNLASALSEFYIRAGIQVDGINITFKLPMWQNGATELGSIRINQTTGFVEIYTGTATLVATGAISLQADTYYLLEVHVKIDDTVGIIEVKVDGVADASFSGDTKPGAATNIDGIFYNGVGTVAFWVDDLALNDTTGGVDDSWCGDGKVALIKANANGDQSDLVGSDADSVDNYLLVDEVPKDDDTTYVEGSVISGYDLYNLAATGLTNVAILRAWPEGRARDTVAEGGLCQLGIKPNGGSEAWSSDISLLTSYTRIIGTVHTVNPLTTDVWGVSELDALQAGFKVK